MIFRFVVFFKVIQVWTGFFGRQACHEFCRRLRFCSLCRFGRFKRRRGRFCGLLLHRGELLAERAKSAGVDTVVFDRGGNKYHGRVAALADGARDAGLAF